MPTPLLSLPLILLAVGFLLYLLLPFPMALKLLRPPRMSDGKAVHVLKRLSPADLGLQFEDRSFPIRDEQTGQPLTITAWRIPRPGSARTAILIHGYADAKVGSIAWAPLFHGLGYHVLAVDLRAHGSSGGTNVTAGFWERHDLSQLLSQLHAQHPAETRHVILFGVSLGAAVAIATAAIRDDVSAVVVESPFADYPTAILSHADLMGMPGPGFVRRAIARAQKIAQADFAEVSPARLIPNLPCPILVISAAEDPLVGPSLPLLQSAVAARPDASAFWKVPNAYHVESMLADPDEYRRRIQSFLAGVTSSASPSTPDLARHSP